MNSVAPSNAYRSYVLFALCVVGFMHQVDKQVMSMFMQPIKKEFMLSDTDLGMMTGIAFSIMSGLVSIPISLYADRHNRKNVISASFIVWTIMTAASGLATSFWTMFAARFGVGIGEAGSVPASHSMIGDYYPSALRPRALAALGASISLGGLFAHVSGGYLVQTVGWRNGFQILGWSGLALALIFHFTVREPQRESATRPGKIGLRAFVGELVDRRAFVLILLMSICSSMAIASLVWFPAYLQRAFDMKPLQIGIGMGISAGLAHALGTILGGHFGQRYFRRSKSWAARYGTVMWLVVTPLFVACFFAPTPMMAFALLFAAASLSGSAFGPIMATLQELVSSHGRATAFAVLAISAAIIGHGLGPYLVGILSDRFQGAGMDAAQGLRLGMAILSLPVALAGILSWMLARRIEEIKL